MILWFYNITGSNDSSLNNKNDRENYFKWQELSMQCQDLVQIWLQGKYKHCQAVWWISVSQTSCHLNRACWSKIGPLTPPHWNNPCRGTISACLLAEKQRIPWIYEKHHLEVLSMFKAWFLAQSWKKNSLDSVFVPRSFISVPVGASFCLYPATWKGKANDSRTNLI